jgi:hypothetical protein
MAILDDVRTVLGITDQDALLNIYIRKAVTLITIYLNMKPTTPAIDIPTTYPDAVIEYVTISMNKHGNEGLKQFTQGSRNGTYGNELPESVIALLPAPYAKLLQTTPAPTGVILP